MPSTSHISIVDRLGNAIAMTTTIESAFGSMQMTKGFLLNDQRTDFSLSPTDAQGNPVANRVQPGKRPAATTRWSSTSTADCRALSSTAVAALRPARSLASQRTPAGPAAPTRGAKAWPRVTGSHAARPRHLGRIAPEAVHDPPCCSRIHRRAGDCFTDARSRLRAAACPSWDGDHAERYRI
ncbi:MAG: hypothetical protein FJW22_15190 [Acidimicrobiia bacterium]|nr:hypothetical protein [Acidimicrobiia bacterium]